MKERKNGSNTHHSQFLSELDLAISTDKSFSPSPHRSKLEKTKTLQVLKETKEKRSKAVELVYQWRSKVKAKQTNAKLAKFREEQREAAEMDPRRAAALGAIFSLANAKKDGAGIGEGDAGAAGTEVAANGGDGGGGGGGEARERKGVDWLSFPLI